MLFAQEDPKKRRAIYKKLMMVILDNFENFIHNQFNPFVPNAPFLYLLKISENRAIFWCFQGVEKGCVGNECIKKEQFRNLKITFEYIFDL